MHFFNLSLSWVLFRLPLTDTTKFSGSVPKVYSGRQFYNRWVFSVKLRVKLCCFWYLFLHCMLHAILYVVEWLPWYSIFAINKFIKVFRILSGRVKHRTLNIVLCRRSGLYLRNYFGRGSGPIWLDRLQCTGYESSLAECGHRGWGVLYRCRHYEDVSIVCANSK